MTPWLLSLIYTKKPTKNASGKVLSSLGFLYFWENFCFLLILFMKYTKSDRSTKQRIFRLCGITITLELMIPSNDLLGHIVLL